MKQILLILFFAMFLLFSACGKSGSPENGLDVSSEPESSFPSSEPESSPISSEPEPLVTPDATSSAAEQVSVSQADNQPTESPPFEGTGIPGSASIPQWKAGELITFLIQDESGVPVPFVSGGLEVSFGEGATGAVAYTTLTSEPFQIDTAPPLDSLFHTGTDGTLYYRVSPDDKNNPFLGAACTLKLSAYYDPAITQSVMLDMPGKAPEGLVITWKGVPPPVQRPPQTTGVRFLIVDRTGNPVKGVTLFGTDYPKEHEGPVPAIAGPYIGPTDETGVIRWEKDFEAGTYPLSFFMEGAEGAEQAYTLKHPGGKKLMEVTIVWEY